MWFLENLNVVATLGSAAAVYFFIRQGAKRDIEQMQNDIREIKQEVKSIDQRLTRLEGAFEERGRWESR